MRPLSAALERAHLQYVAPVETVMRYLVVIVGLQTAFLLAVIVLHRLLDLDILLTVTVIAVSMVVLHLLIGIIVAKVWMGQARAACHGIAEAAQKRDADGSHRGAAGPAFHANSN